MGSQITQEQLTEAVNDAAKLAALSLVNDITVERLEHAVIHDVGLKEYIKVSSDMHGLDNVPEKMMELIRNGVLHVFREVIEYYLHSGNYVSRQFDDAYGENLYILRNPDEE